MSISCAISGEIPEDPVVSVKSGHIFERRLIEKYLETTGKCPITDVELSKEDILPINLTSKFVKPRTPIATSIPSMIGLFQNEWDAVVLESFTLRQQLEQTRQELSHALYQHEAACRVIARLLKERDEAREMLAKSSPVESVPVKNGDKMDDSPKGISQEVVDKITELSKKLMATRKKKIPVEGLVSLESLQSFEEIYNNHSLHSSAQRGITTLDVHPNENLILTGGMDKNIVLLDREKEVIVDVLKGHQKPVTDVLFHPTQDVILSSSSDNTFRVWSKDKENKYESAHVFDIHKDIVSGLSIHPSGDYFASTSFDSTWCFVDINIGKVLKQVSKKDFNQGFTTVQFHPDGIILGTGCGDSTVKIWNTSTQDNVASFDCGQGRISSLSFSENGYHLATCAEDNTVKLWDLRKLTNFKTLTFDESEAISCVHFDHSGTHLAVASSKIRVISVPQWNEVISFGETNSSITDIKFNKKATNLYSVGLDRHLRIFGNKN